MDLKVEAEEIDSNQPPPIEVFAHSSTLHGISHIFTYERFCIKRCLWVVFFLGSLTFLLYVCVDRIHFYLEYPHVTKLDEVTTPILTFPAVTFCNLNAFRFSRVTRNDLYHAGELLALLNQRYEIRDIHFVEETVLESLKVKADFHNFKPRPFNMREFYERTGHDISDMLLACHFHGTECRAEDFKVSCGLVCLLFPQAKTDIYIAKHKNCVQTDGGLVCFKVGEMDRGQDERSSGGTTAASRKAQRSEEKFLSSGCQTACTTTVPALVFTRYGKCYTFNAGGDGRPPLTTSKGGMGNGLELMLDIQQDEYLPVWGETDETSFEAGIKVQIHSQDEPSFIDQLGFGVAPGFQTFVSCQEQRLIYLPPPWGDCKVTPMDSDFFDSYSITACRIDCETRYLVDNCNCRMVHMPGDAPYCTPELYKECADPALGQAELVCFSPDFLVERDNDFCVCETPCNMTRYSKELSFVKIPSKASAKYLAKKYNKSEQYIKENILVLDIFFEALNYETIEQKKAYEVAGLLGTNEFHTVIKYKLCRCSEKKHKHNNDQGTVLSLDDVKCHGKTNILEVHCEENRPETLNRQAYSLSDFWMVLLQLLSAKQLKTLI
ncbi:Acid-sensing ion channel 1B [Channa argus]|uniref:Acid-sensing ion channel 1B n=1 Tax=Channa argus TaxID=215402 RepID=A0A6G1Q4K7_CHAAH|nr:Acid-sensing ion channel 1B [Channa argus]